MSSSAVLTEAQVIADFTAAMADAGLRPVFRRGEFMVADGKIQRFHVEGDPRGTKNGWYVLFVDGTPAGEFGCWKRGIQQTWCSKSDKQLTPREREEVARRIEQARAQREAEIRERQDAVAAEARELWEAAQPLEGKGHPYLERKNVDSHGLRLGTWPTGVPALLVPMMNTAWELRSLQAIFANKNPRLGRDKDFLAGGQKRGCFAPIGQPPAGDGAGAVIQLAEGYATGASVYQATGHFTAVAFDAYNLKPVLCELRRRWPAATFLVAADNDRWTGPTPDSPHVLENPGVTRARECAELSRVFVAPVEFTDEQIGAWREKHGKGDDTGPTDFNDLHELGGLGAVRDQLLAALPKPPEAANDNQPQHLPLDANLSPFGFPHLSDKGQPLNTPENLAYLLSEYGITCRYNVISKDLEISIPGRQFSLDNRAAAALATVTGLCARARVPRENLGDYLLLIADSNPVNPPAEWIESKPWDGVDRIQDLARTLDPADPDLAIALLRRWLIGGAAAVYEPDGVSLQGVLVLQGAQHLGKTTWLMGLANHNRRLVMEGATLNPSDKDSVKQAVSYWIVELGELDATFRKSDIAALKAFLTRKQDDLRLPYSKVYSQFPRRTAFVASVNDKAYLRDETGNRRYWTIQCGEGLNAMHGIDMQQVWAQARQLYLDGEQYRLTSDELDRLNRMNVEHQEVSPIEELVLSRFDWESAARPTAMTATDVLIAIGYDRPNAKQVREAGTILRKICGGEPRKSGSRRVFDMPQMLGIRPSLWADGDDDRPL